MQFIPKKIKHKKQQKKINFDRIIGVYSFSKLNYGVLGIKSMASGTLTSKQLLTLKQTINKGIKKIGKLKLNIFSDIPVTKKPLEIRMGKGKGGIDHWIAKIKAGKIICEIQVSNQILGLKALKNAQIRLPFLTKILTRLS